MRDARRSLWAHSLGRRLWGKPVYVWLLWALTMPALAYAAVALADTALWMWAVDPELVAVIAVAAGQQCWAEVAALWRRARAPRPGGDHVIRWGMALGRHGPATAEEGPGVTEPPGASADPS